MANTLNFSEAASCNEPVTPLFRVPIGGVLWIPAAYSLPQRQLFDQQIRPRRDGSLTPNVVFDFLGILFKDNEVKVIKLEELADFIREGSSQFLRFAARSDRFTDAHNRLVAVAACLRLNDRLCAHRLIFSAESPRFNLPQTLR